MLLLSWVLYFLNDFIHTHVSYASLHMGRCVFACLSVCEQTSRSAEVQLAMTLLCLIGTAVTVTFRNAMNQCQGGTGRQTKNNQLYSIQIDTGWTGQRERERDGGTLNSLQGRINTREWGHRLTGDLLGCNTNTLTLRANVNPSVTRWTLKKMFNAFFIINRDRNEWLHWYLLLYFLQPTKVLFYVLSIVFPSSCERLSVFFYRLQAPFTFIVLNVPRLRRA